MHNLKVDRNVSEGSIDYSALFTGAALLKPVGVNPNREELIKLRDLGNIADSVSEPNYVDITMKSGSVMSVVDFFFELDPVENFGSRMPKGEKYKESISLNIPIMVSKEKVFTKSGDKIQIIDQHNQSMYVPYIEGLSVTEMLDQYHTSLVENNGSDYLKRLCEDFCKESARHACVGEVALYANIQSMTVLAPHNVRKIKGEPVPLNGFVLGGDIAPDKATEQFEKIVDGDVSIIKTVLDSDICKHADGNQAHVYGLLGVRESSGKYYQDIYRSLREASVFSDMSKKVDYGKYGSANIPKSAFKNITDAEYGWSSFWNDSFVFQKFDPSIVNRPSNSVLEDDVNDDDDFPF